MACFVTSKGRKIAENENYRLMENETIVPGLIDWDCGPGFKGDSDYALLQETAKESNLPLGDFIEKAIKLIPEKIRPKHCSKCEQRRLALNRIKELGIKETIKKLREIS